MTEALPVAGLEPLFRELSGRGYRIVGPTVRDGAIVYDEIHAPSDLPVGLTDKQAPGSYRLEKRDDERAFGYVVGPHSYKQYLFPPREPLVQIRTGADGPRWREHQDESPPLALLGVRSCELSAIRIQDRVLTGGPFVDGRYRARRERCLIVALDCTEAGDLCFCASMDTGPEVRGDYDLRATELDGELLLSAGTETGRELLDALPTHTVPEATEQAAKGAIEACARSMGREVQAEGLPARLMGNLKHARWQDVAERCIGCGNCTAVCPTCFCFDVVDGSDLSGKEATRERQWDSCFNPDHSSIHGGRFRPDVRGRYQQWLTHKFATWTSQFGESGCVGCGRCIAWCPVGIDVTDELNAIAADPGVEMSLPQPVEHPLGSDSGLLPAPARVLQVVTETHDVATLTLEVPADYQHGHGQFNMLSLPGVGEVPISISGSRAGAVEHTIRAVGATTRALCEARPGTVLGLRGPFGTSWPIEEARGRPVVAIAGGIGLAPLRSVLLHMRAHPDDFPSVRVLFGARSPADLPFGEELREWVQGDAFKAHVTVDRSDRTWRGNVGAVTTLIRRKRTPSDALYLVCGPEVMMTFALDALRRVGVPTSHIYLSLERNMKCAAGLCGRCQYGPHFVCKDGPVFRYDEIAPIFGKPGF